jgi:hypothetical protein
MKMTTRPLVNYFAAGSIAVLAATFGSVSAAQAAAITSLYNTGVDASGAVLPDSTVGDSHYTLTDPNGDNLSILSLSDPSKFPLTVYNSFVTSAAPSSWIGPTTLNNFTGIPGNYTYRTTFDLSNFIANTAQINGNWGTDNGGVDILLNGVSIGAGSTNPGFGGGYSSFTIANTGNNFVDGINTLDFVVNNAGSVDSPVALRAELNGTADINPAAVPEPSDFIGTAIAFGSVVMLKRNFSKKAK